VGNATLGQKMTIQRTLSHWNALGIIHAQRTLANALATVAAKLPAH
jgi:hypothetical protein